MKLGRKRRSVSESPDTSRDTTPARTTYTPKYVAAPSTPARKQTIDDDKQYKCHLCQFSTDRLNVIILHNKTHSNDKPIQPVKTPRKYRPPSVKYKLYYFHPPFSIPFVEPRKKPGPTPKRLSKSVPPVRTQKATTRIVISDEDEDNIIAGRATSKSPPKKRQTKKSIATATAIASQVAAEPPTKSTTKKVASPSKTPVPISNPIEIKNSLLADWCEDDDSDFDFNDSSPTKLLADSDSAPLRLSPPSQAATFRNIPKKDRRGYIYNEFYQDHGSSGSKTSTTSAVIVLDSDDDDFEKSKDNLDASKSIDGDLETKEDRQSDDVDKMDVDTSKESVQSDDEKAESRSDEPETVALENEAKQDERELSENETNNDSESKTNENDAQPYDKEEQSDKEDSSADLVLLERGQELLQETSLINKDIESVHHGVLNKKRRLLHKHKDSITSPSHQKELDETLDTNLSSKSDTANSNVSKNDLVPTETVGEITNEITETEIEPIKPKRRGRPPKAKKVIESNVDEVANILPAHRDEPEPTAPQDKLDVPSTNEEIVNVNETETTKRTRRGRKSEQIEEISTRRSSRRTINSQSIEETVKIDEPVPKDDTPAAPIVAIFEKVVGRGRGRRKKSAAVFVENKIEATITADAKTAEANPEVISTDAPIGEALTQETDGVEDEPTLKEIAVAEANELTHHDQATDVIESKDEQVEKSETVVGDASNTPIDGSPTKFDSKDTSKSDIDCFDFKEDEEEEMPKALNRRKRRCLPPGKVFELETIDKLEEIRKKEEDQAKRFKLVSDENGVKEIIVAAATATATTATTAIEKAVIESPDLIEATIQISKPQIDNSVDDSAIDRGGKEDDVKENRTLPPKERGKRIFKSRNRSHLSESDTSLNASLEENRTATDSKDVSPVKVDETLQNGRNVDEFDLDNPGGRSKLKSTEKKRKRTYSERIKNVQPNAVKDVVEPIETIIASLSTDAETEKIILTNKETIAEIPSPPTEEVLVVEIIADKPVEHVDEIVTEPPTEPPTDPPTEPPTEPPIEPPTEQVEEIGIEPPTKHIDEQIAGKSQSDAEQAVIDNDPLDETPATAAVAPIRKRPSIEAEQSPKKKSTEKKRKMEATISNTTVEPITSGESDTPRSPIKMTFSIKNKKKETVQMEIIRNQTLPTKPPNVKSVASISPTGQILSIKECTFDGSPAKPQSNPVHQLITKHKAELESGPTKNRKISVSEGISTFIINTTNVPGHLTTAITPPGDQTATADVHDIKSIPVIITNELIDIPASSGKLPIPTATQPIQQPPTILTNAQNVAAPKPKLVVKKSQLKPLPIGSYIGPQGIVTPPLSANVSVPIGAQITPSTPSIPSIPSTSSKTQKPITQNIVPAKLQNVLPQKMSPQKGQPTINKPSEVSEIPTSPPLTVTPTTPPTVTPTTSPIQPQSSSITSNKKQKAKGGKVPTQIGIDNEGNPIIIMRKPSTNPIVHLPPHLQERDNQFIANKLLASAASQQIIQSGSNQLVITSKGTIMTTNTASAGPMLSNEKSNVTTTPSITHTSQLSPSPSPSTSKGIKSNSPVKQPAGKPQPKIQVHSQKIICRPNDEKAIRSSLTTQQQLVKDLQKRGFIINEAATDATALFSQQSGQQQIIIQAKKSKTSQAAPSAPVAAAPQPIPQSTSQQPVKTTNKKQSPKVPVRSSAKKQAAPQQIKEAEKPAAISVPAEPLVEVAPNMQDNQLLAIPAENFDGPPGAFYLCTAENNTYYPIDRQPLYLDDNNQLIPAPSEPTNVTAVAHEAIQSGASQTAADYGIAEEQIVNNLGQLDDPSNPTYLINTGDGQQILLDQQSLLQLTQGEMPQLITADGQQIILQGSPQDLLAAIANSQQEVAEQRILLQDNMAIVQEDDAGNHDILAAALADTEVFQQEQYIGGDALQMQTGSCAFQTIHQAATSETNAILTLPPIMSTLEQPSKSDLPSANVDCQNLDASLAVIGVSANQTNVPSSLELPITVTNQKYLNIHAKTTNSITGIYPSLATSTVALNAANQLSPTIPIADADEFSYEFLTTALSGSNGSADDSIIATMATDDDTITKTITATATRTAVDLDQSSSMEDSNSIVLGTPESVTFHQRTPELTGFLSENSNESEISLQSNLILRPTMEEEAGEAATHEEGNRSEADIQRPRQLIHGDNATILNRPTFMSNNNGHIYDEYTTTSTTMTTTINGHTHNNNSNNRTVNIDEVPFNNNDDDDNEDEGNSIR